MRKFPWAFFVLVGVLALPFWFGGVFIERALPNAVPINLPFAALIFVCPVTAALILSVRERGWAGARELLARSVDVKRIRRKRWLLPVFLLFPALLAVSYGVMVLQGTAIRNVDIPWAFLPVAFVLFYIGGLGEELGWQAYAFDRMEPRLGTLRAALVLGIIWALFHIVPFIQMGKPLVWIVSQNATQVLTRVLIVWLYSNTGKSIFAATAFHAMTNVGEFFFPNYGSSYNPTILAAVLLVTVILVVWKGNLRYEG